MALTKYKLGDLIEQTDERNRSGLYTLDDVKGISTEKKFIDTKANMDGVSLDSYKVVNPGEFTYVADTSRRGDKIALAYNGSKNAVLISSIYTTFRICREDLLIPVYLFMYFNRPEFDRYARFNSWGSARETFSWEDMCDVDITLPSIEQQRKYVNIYLSLQKNLEAYQSNINDLKVVCDAYLDLQKVKSKRVKVGDLLIEIDCRNTKNKVKSVSGINIEKRFMDSVADTNDVDLSKYKVVHENEFAFSGMQTGRDKCIRIALNDENRSLIVSPAYTVLKINNESILGQYIMMWFSRKEIDRYGWFASDASIRSNLDMERFLDMEIPLPILEIQKNIVNMYNCYIERQRIATQLKEQLNNICPILINGSLETEK